MARISPRTREKAFKQRLQRRSYADIAREVGVSPKTLSRWENGWVDGKGTKHAGWKADLERAWREKADEELQFGLMLKDARLKTYEELAQLAVAKIKEAFPHINAKTAGDVKSLISEVRELLKMLAKEKGEWSPNPQTVVAVKTDISFEQLRERYMDAQIVEAVGSDREATEDEEKEDQEYRVAKGEGPDETAL